MRKFVVLLALLVVVSGARLAKADTTENITFGYSGGSMIGTESLSNGQVKSISLDGFTLKNFSGSNNLLQNCTSGCSWSLSELFGSVFLTISGGGKSETASCSSCANFFSFGTIASGRTNGPSTSMPEPPVYLLALLGIFLTRNRISQGMRQALRWNN